MMMMIMTTMTMLALLLTASDGVAAAAQIHPGLVKTALMGNSEFYGKGEDEDRRSFRQAMRMLPITSTPQDVAQAIYNAVVTKQKDVVLGLPFAAAANAYKLTGLNPSALPFITR